MPRYYATAAQERSLNQARDAGLIISWEDVSGRGLVVITGGMAEIVLHTEREAGLACGILDGAVCALRDGKARTDA